MLKIIGDALLVAPVLDQGATTVSVYLPEGVWYDFYKYDRYEPGYHTVNANEDTVSSFSCAHLSPNVLELT